MIKRFRLIIPCIVFLLLILISFRNVLFTPGIIGHTWDWGMPHFSDQYLDKIKDNFFIWDDSMGGGRYFYFKFELLFWILVFPFSFFGAELASKIIPMFFLFISGIFMYKLCKYYKLNTFWAIMAGVFYMFSPVNYSRVITGHMPILLGYSLLPLFVMHCQKLMDRLSENKRVKFKDIFLVSLLYSFQSIHPIVLISSSIIFLTFIGWYFLFSRYRLRLIKILVPIFFLVLVLNSFWVAPVVLDYIENRTVGQGAGLSVSPGKKVTVESELPLRKGYLGSTQQPVHRGFLLLSNQGMATEYVWPIPSNWRLLWVVLSCGICTFFFIGLFKGRFSAFLQFGHYFILALMGIILIAGYSNFIGVLVYKIIEKILPLYILFSHTPRLLILVVVSYSTVGFFVLSKIEDFLEWKMLYRSISCACLAVVILPFINGKITKPLIKGATQPLSLKINKINTEDELVYEFFKNHPEDFRLAYLPQVLMSWPGETDLTYEWNVMGGLAPKPEFFGHPDGSLLAWSFTRNLYSDSVSPWLSKLLGLASVKYLVYPHYNFFVSYKNFHPGYKPDIVVEGFKNYKPILDENLPLVQGLYPLNTDFDTVSIFENKMFIPHIYAADNIGLIFSNSEDYYVPLSYTDFWDSLPCSIYVRGERHLKTIREKLDIDEIGLFAVLGGEDSIVDFYISEDGEYEISTRLIPKYTYIDNPIGGGYIDFNLEEEWNEWDFRLNMISFNYKLTQQDGVLFYCYFDGPWNEDEYLQLKRKGLKIDIKEYRHIELDYKVKDPVIQTIEIVAGLDFNEDGLVDNYLRGIYPHPSKDVFTRFKVDLYSIAKKSFPEEKFYTLIELELYPHKIWGKDCSDIFFKGDYLFWIKGVHFVKYNSIKVFKAKKTMTEYKGSEALGNTENWEFLKRTIDPQVSTEGQEVFLKNEGKYYEIYKVFKEPLNLPKWRYIEFEYKTPMLDMKSFSLVIDLVNKKDLLIMPLEPVNSFKYISIDIFSLLKGLYPELENYELEKIRFCAEVYNNKPKMLERYALEETIFNVRNLLFYDVGFTDKIEFKAPLLVIDKDNYFREMEVNKDNFPNNIYWKQKINIQEGWHTLIRLGSRGEDFIVDWILINSLRNRKFKERTSQVDFVKVNPAIYKAYIESDEFPLWLVFLENFHKGWKAYIRPSGKDSAAAERSWLGTNHWWSKTALGNMLNLSGMKELKNHFEVNGYANGWLVEKEDISKGNKLEVTIEFYPQRYYELGLVLSGVVLIIGFATTLFDRSRGGV